MVKISAKGCYAVQIMADLALQEMFGDEVEYIPLKRISERRGIYVIKYLEQVVALLQKAGFLKSLRGNNGGYRLSRSSKEYTVGEILRVTEGSLDPLDCLDGAKNDCGRNEK